MKLLKYILFCILLSTVLFATEVSFTYFTTKSDGKDISIEWQPNAEKGVLRYEIERSSDNQNYSVIHSVEAKGQWTSYHWIDQDVFMKQTSNQQIITKGNFYYRLKIVATDNTITFSNSSSVIHNISSVRRTWGMIKEMFK